VALPRVSRSPRTRWAVAAAVVLGGLLPVAGAPPSACAAESPRAVLVVDTGPSTHRYCVALPDEAVSGTELIELAGEQHGLSYGFGFGGGAVCMLAGVGPTGGDCFEDYPDFWAYWRSDGSGGWTWGSTGAASTTVSDGDVEGWAWGSGDGPDSHPAPPSTTFSSVCKPVHAPDPKPDQEPNHKPEQPASTGAPPDPGAPPDDEGRRESGSSEPDGDPKKKDKESARERGDRVASRTSPLGEVTPAPSPSPRAAPPIDRTSSEGPPPAGVAGLVAALALGGAGAFIARRRMGRGDPG